MNKLLIAASVVALSASAANAADMAANVYRKAPVAAVPFTWTGFYIGGNVGWGQTKSDFATTLVPTGFTAASAAFITALGTGRATKDGFTGGGQIGYNYQFAPNWVAGVEADINALSQTASLFGAGTTPGGTVISNFTNDLKSEWIATFRGRFGYAFDRSLIYATGGLAVLGSKYSQTFISSGPNRVSSSSQTTAGWTVGGGWEYAVSNNWSLKGEYLFARFENINVGPVFLLGTDPLSGKTNVDVQMARVGANYKF